MQRDAPSPPLPRPISPPPYAPPVVERGRPKVIAWYRVYAAASVLIYLAGAELCGVLGHPGYAALSVLVAVFFAFATFVPYKPWGWTLALFAIGLGAVAPTGVASFVLGLLWFRPLTKAAFGRL